MNKYNPINTKKEYDLLIVGTGIYGVSAAYNAKQESKRCLVIGDSNYNASEI